MSSKPKHFDELCSLHANLIDARNGYEEGLTLTEDTAVVAVFRDLLELRDRHIENIDRMLQIEGTQPDSTGSWMTPVHKGIMNVRSWFGQLDASVLDHVIDGEQHIVDKFTDAISSIEGQHADKSDLERMRDELKTKIEKLKLMVTT